MILYKYCPWNTNNEEKRNYTKENLINSQLYFSKASLFNDPFELSPVFDTSGTNTEKMVSTIQMFKIRYHNKSNTRLKKFAHHYLRENNLFKNNNDNNLITYFNDSMVNKIGIACFTTCYDNILMWSHYADKHNGICLKFDYPDSNPIVEVPSEHKYPKVFLYKVCYELNRPAFSIFKDWNNGGHKMLNFFITKAKMWEYEKEYRAFIIDLTGLFSYNPNYLKAVYIGCNTPLNSIMEIKSILSSLENPPALYKMNLDKNYYKLNHEFIDY